MNVCFLSGARYSQPLDETREKKFRALAGLGNLFVVGFSESIRPRRFVEHAHFYLLPRLPLPILRYAEMFTLGPLLALWLILRHGIEVLVAQSPYEGSMAALVKKIAGRLGRKVALVIESHGDFEESLFLQRRILLAGPYRYLMRRAARFAFSHADVLRAVSHSTRQQLEQWAPGRPIFQFPAWTDIEVFLQAGSERHENPSQEILYAGALIPRKGIHHLVNAFARIASGYPRATLVIAGPGENRAYAAALNKQVECLGLDGRVKFMEEVPQVELAAWMRRACVFVLPTYSEGLPRVILEAMAVGRPVISSAVSGIPEIIHDGTTGFLVPPGDEAALAERLRWVLDHPDAARQMGPRASAFAEQFFSTESYVQSYARVFEEAGRIIRETEVRMGSK